MQKICIICGELTNSLLRGMCRKCYNIDYYESNKDKITERHLKNYQENKHKRVKLNKEYRQKNKYKIWKYEILKRYSIKPSKYYKILRLQGYKCPICDIGYLEFRINEKLNRRFSVDHCHDKIIIRGVLCNKCNRHLGFSGDNIQSIKQKAKREIDYLTSYKEIQI